VTACTSNFTLWKNPGNPHLMRSKTTKMGMYIAMIMAPMMMPITTIISG